jgi:hypothetical protein
MTTATAVSVIHSLHSWSEPNTLGVPLFLPHDIVQSITELALIHHREDWNLKCDAERFGSRFINPCIDDADAIARRRGANNFMGVLNENWTRVNGWGAHSCYPPIRQRWDEDWGIDGLREMGALRRNLATGDEWSGATKISIVLGRKFIGYQTLSRAMWEWSCRQCSLNFYLNQPRNRF